MRAGCALAALAAALLLAAAVRAESVKLAVVIGNNLGHDATRALRWAENDARKMHQVLTELGAVEPGAIQLLLGRSASDAWRAIRQAEGRVRALRAQPGRRVMLVVYYSGHADGSVLELGTSSLRYDALTEFLRTSRADVRLAFVDSCRSGQLVAMKGGRRGGAGFRIQIADEWARGFAVITSSAADELSQEAAEIRGSFFTHYLVSGLRGAADQSGDGRVTLGEAYRYAYGRTVARTSATVGGSQHPMYDYRLAGHGDIVLTSHSGASTLEVASATPARVLVLDATAQAMVAEGQAAADRPLKLALAAGGYQVLLLEGPGRLARARLALARGQALRLERRDFAAESPGRGWAKGGPFRPAVAQRLSAGLLVGRMPLAAGSVTLGTAARYELEPWPGWRLALRASWATAPDAGISTGYHDLGAQAGLGFGWPWRVPLVLSLLAGYQLMRQSEREGTRWSSGFSYLGSAGLEVPLGDLLLEAALAAGGRVFRLRPEQLVHRLDLQLTVGAGWRWGYR